MLEGEEDRGRLEVDPLGRGATATRVRLGREQRDADFAGHVDAGDPSQRGMNFVPLS